MNTCALPRDSLFFLIYETSYAPYHPEWTIYDKGTLNIR